MGSPNWDEIRKLDSDVLEKTLSWGIQRQLRWAVFSVTNLVVLLTLFGLINTSLFQLILTETAAVIVVLLLVFIALLGFWISVGRVIDYYHYVAKIEEFWVKKMHKKNWCAEEDVPNLTERSNVFSVHDRIDHFIMQCPSNAKSIARSAILILIPLLFFRHLPLLLRHLLLQFG